MDNNEIEDYKQWLELFNNRASEEQIKTFLHGQEVPNTWVANDKGEQPVLKPSGPGVLGCLTRFSEVKGHYDATKEVLVSLSTLTDHPIILKDHIIESIATASRLPDLLHFHELAYHAQSITNEHHLLVDKEKDKKDFQLLLWHCIDSSLKCLTKQQVITQSLAIEFCYHFGTVLHMVQDLACHQGMSNPEHAYRDKKGLSPDLSNDRYNLAKEASFFTIQTYYIEPLKTSLTQLNNFPSLTNWHEFETAKNLANVIKGAGKFTLDPWKQDYSDSKDKNKYKSRWFYWDEYTEEIPDGLNIIKEIIMKFT